MNTRNLVRLYVCFSPHHSSNELLEDCSTVLDMAKLAWESGAAYVGIEHKDGSYWEVSR